MYVSTMSHTMSLLADPIIVDGVVIVGSYVNQLEEERDAKAKAEVPPAPSFVAPVQPAYAPTYQYNPMGGQQQQYAFSSTQNSYGHA
jgi:hypothetical protein